MKKVPEASGKTVAEAAIVAVGAMPAKVRTDLPAVRQPALKPERFELPRWPGECRLVRSDGEWLGVGVDEDWMDALLDALMSMPPPESR